MTESASPDRRWLAWGIGLVVLALAATVFVKYRLIEPVPYASACERQQGPWFGCLVRAGFVMLFVKNIAGTAALLLGLWSTVTRARLFAFAAVALGGTSIILYRFDAGIVGLMLGLLVLARAAVAGPEQGGGTEQEQAREA